MQILNYTASSFIAVSVLATLNMTCCAALVKDKLVVLYIFAYTPNKHKCIISFCPSTLASAYHACSLFSNPLLYKCMDALIMRCLTPDADAIPVQTCELNKRNTTLPPMSPQYGCSCSSPSAWACGRRVNNFPTCRLNFPYESCYTPYCDAEYIYICI